MALTENLLIYKDTLVLCKILLKYSKTVSKIVRYSTYNEAVSKACAALDMIRRINESWTEREDRIHEYILLMSEVNSRINLLTDAEFLNKKQATNLNHLSEKVLREAYGWQKAEQKRKGEVLKRYVNRINSLMGVLTHYDSFNIMRKAWAMMPHKDIVFCVNMKKIKIKKINLKSKKIMEKINFIKTFIPEGQYRQKYEYGDMVVYHINAEYNKEMNAYECYECTLPKATFDETKVRTAFSQFSAKLDALKLEEAKAEKIAEITGYDTSDKVNGFILNGMLVWLDKATRVGLMNSTNIAKAAGQQTTTLWLGGAKLVVDCDKAIQLLSALEMYALECLNATASHKAAVGELKTIEDVKVYDYKTGYPKMLEMSV